VEPSSWTQKYVDVARERVIWSVPVGPFYVDGAETGLIIAPDDTIIRSVKVASAYDEPTRLIVELNGVQVAAERVFPGTQTILLDAPLPIDRTRPVAWQIRLPDLPAEPPGSLWRVSVYGGNSQRDFAIADSQVAMIAELRKRAEQGQRMVEGRRADLDA